MEIGISSACFYPQVDLENTISLMKKLGFKRGELFLNCPSEFEDSFIDRLIEESIKNEFSINSIHPFSSFFEPHLFDTYKRRRDDMMKYFKAVCRAGKRLGAEYYTFHGMRNVDFKFFNHNNIIDIYDELIYTSSEIGIKLAQENVSWCMSSNTEFLETIQQKCKYEINFTLDIKQAYRAGISIEDYIKVMGNRIVNFHINDVDENNMCILPGKGMVDYQDIDKRLKDVGYTGIGIIEVYSDNYRKYNELIDGREYLTKML